MFLIVVLNAFFLTTISYNCDIANILMNQGKFIQLRECTALKFHNATQI